MSAFAPSEDLRSIRALDVSDPLNLLVSIEKHARSRVDPSEDEDKRYIHSFQIDKFDLT